MRIHNTSQQQEQMCSETWLQLELFSLTAALMLDISVQFYKFENAFVILQE